MSISDQLEENLCAIDGPTLAYIKSSPTNLEIQINLMNTMIECAMGIISMGGDKEEQERIFFLAESAIRIFSN